MTACGLPLTSPTGGWIGTVAHIIGAEPDGPRGASPLTPEQRAHASNLILMCATHGREVDAPDTGEAKFPIERLRSIKETHETKISDAVAAAIDQDFSGVQTATGTIDTALRPAVAEATAEGLLESLGYSESDSASARIIAALADARAQLQRLSQPALDTLSQLLELWLLECRDDSTDTYDFGDVSGVGPALPSQNVENRRMQGRQDSFDRAFEELKSRKLVEIWLDEYAETTDFALGALWHPEERRSFNFWISAAWFLREGYDLLIHDWIKGLDFSIFDRVAAADRNVIWR